MKKLGHQIGKQLQNPQMSYWLIGFFMDYSDAHGGWENSNKRQGNCGLQAEMGLGQTWLDYFKLDMCNYHSVLQKNPAQCTIWHPMYSATSQFFSAPT